MSDFVESDFMESLSEKPEKVTVLHFGTNWCKNCERIEPILKELKEKYVDKDVEFEFVDVEEQIEFCEESKVFSIPTTCVLRGDTIVERIIGCHDDDVYFKAVDNALNLTKAEVEATEEEIVNVDMETREKIN